MLGIILHHIHNNLQYGSPVLSQVGYLATALFFFISGYGNHLSLNRKKAGIDWIRRKIEKIYVPFLWAYAVYYVILNIGYKELAPSGTEVFRDLVTVSLPNMVSWFPKIILVCFVIHWVIGLSFKSRQKQLVALSVLIVALVIILWKKGFPSYWFNSVFCYPVGAWFGEYAKTLKKAMNIGCRFWQISLLIILAILCGLVQIHWFFSIMSSIIFCILCFVVSLDHTAKTNYVNWIGRNSFEFYLFHICCLQEFRFMTGQPICYSFCVLGCSVAVVKIYLECRGMLVATIRMRS